MRRRIGIIVGPMWGDRDIESYREQAGRYLRAIKRESAEAVERNPDNSIEAQIFEGDSAVEEAKTWASHYANNAGAIVFLSRGALHVAEKLLEELRGRRRHERVRVIVVTGLLPDDRVQVVGSMWFHGIEWAELTG